MTTVEDAPAPTAVDVGEGEHEPSRRRRWVLPLSVGAALVAAGGVAAWVRADDESSGSSPASAGPVATSVVERGTISATERWDGTLGHAAPFTINSGTEGTVTRLAGQGQRVERGAELYRVDEQPVSLLYGPVPMYRPLRPGDSGADIEQLEANLTALGYDTFTPDDRFDESTAEAVRAWQADLGADPTGMVDRGAVVFVPEPGRVETLHVGVGDVVAPGAPVLDITGTDEVVTVRVDPADRDRLEVDTEVTVVLPDGDEVAGSVNATAVETVPAGDPQGDVEDGSADAESITAVQITIGEDVDDALAGATVEVVVAIDERTDVMLVPVNALLALAEGGYGLEVMGDDGTSTIVPVDTGLFADGRVEVSGAGITEGAVVGVAGR